MVSKGGVRVTKRGVTGSAPLLNHKFRSRYLVSVTVHGGLALLHPLAAFFLQNINNSLNPHQLSSIVSSPFNHPLSLPPSLPHHHFQSSLDSTFCSTSRFNRTHPHLAEHTLPAVPTLRCPRFPNPVTARNTPISRLPMVHTV